MASSSFSRRLRQSSRRFLVGVAPRAYWAYRRWRRGDEEFELRLLPLLCSRQKASVDVGANFGMYTVRMSALSRRCIAFEPIPEFARMLSSGFGRSVEVIAKALSDRTGTAELRVPDLFTGYSTIDPANRLTSRESDPIKHLGVDVTTLDDFDFTDVGFIKIDVEGHEESVLRGASATLARCRPNLLVEVEDRHNAGSVGRIVAWMAERGYAAFVIVAGALKDLQHFDLGRHQAETAAESYARNIIFLPDERRAALCERIEGLLHQAPTGTK